MKIKIEHFNHIKNSIEKFLNENPAIINDYETGNFIRADRVKDLNTRFRWDLSHLAGLTPYFARNIYQYAHDDHIETVLKKVVPKITRRY